MRSFVQKDILIKQKKYFIAENSFMGMLLLSNACPYISEGDSI
jgi:hypothetical protein